jgi:hypothetical protein
MYVCMFYGMLWSPWFRCCLTTIFKLNSQDVSRIPMKPKDFWIYKIKGTRDNPVLLLAWGFGNSLFLLALYISQLHCSYFT